MGPENTPGFVLQGSEAQPSANPAPKLRRGQARNKPTSFEVNPPLEAIEQLMNRVASGRNSISVLLSLVMFYPLRNPSVGSVGGKPALSLSFSKCGCALRPKNEEEKYSFIRPEAVSQAVGLLMVVSCPWRAVI